MLLTTLLGVASGRARYALLAADMLYLVGASAMRDSSLGSAARCGVWANQVCLLYLLLTCFTCCWHAADYAARCGVWASQVCFTCCWHALLTANMKNSYFPV
jgi:hypothetical protein